MTPSIHTILVGTDFSEGSARALLHAVNLAQKLSARLDLLYVLDLPPPAWGEMLLGPDDGDPILRALGKLREVREKIVEARLSHDVAKDYLGAVLHCGLVVLHVQRRLLGIDYLEVDDGVDLCRDVVGGDDLLLEQITIPDPVVDPYEPVDAREHEVEAWGDTSAELAEPELEADLPLVDLPHAAKEIETYRAQRRHEDEQTGERGRIGHVSTITTGRGKPPRGAIEAALQVSLRVSRRCGWATRR